MTPLEFASYCYIAFASAYAIAVFILCVGIRKTTKEIEEQTEKTEKWISNNT